MKILWIFAHPEKKSLSGSLHEYGVQYLVDAGHEVVVSDLYAMKWDPVVTRSDFPDEEAERLMVALTSKSAFEADALSPDIKAEQDKLEWADATVIQFPLWWYNVPAILKGWIDRVFVMGFGYGVGDPTDPSRSLRYGEGRLQGKRAMVVLTAGSSEESCGPRGINGPMDHLLFPLLHGTLWYTGLSVLPPAVFYSADWYQPEDFPGACAELRARLATMFDAEPLPYRTQTGGDYVDGAVLRPEVAPGTAGFDAHSI